MIDSAECLCILTMLVHKWTNDCTGMTSGGDLRITTRNDNKKKHMAEVCSESYFNWLVLVGNKDILHTSRIVNTSAW